MNILGITLARAGSKGLPGKHTRILGGKPVIAWTIEAAKASEYLADYVVSTNDDEIARVVYQYVGVPVLRRPNELCQDTTPTLPALQWSVQILETLLSINTRKTYDYIVEIRATSPLKTTQDIDGIIKTLIESDADSVIGITPLEDHHPARAKYLSPEGYLRDFIPELSTRRQELEPKAYIRNGTVYALKRSALFAPDAKLWGHEKSIGYVLPEERSVNLDTPLDLIVCEALLKKGDR